VKRDARTAIFIGGLHGDARSGASLFLPTSVPRLQLTQAMAHRGETSRVDPHFASPNAGNAILAPFMALSFLLLSHANSWSESYL